MTWLNGHHRFHDPFRTRASWLWEVVIGCIISGVGFLFSTGLGAFFTRGPVARRLRRLVLPLFFFCLSTDAYMVRPSDRLRKSKYGREATHWLGV
jgi:hypothetical protein